MNKTKNNTTTNFVPNDEITAIVKRLVEAISPEKIYLFGSYARGDYNEDSDYDFYVVMEDPNTDKVVISQNAYLALYDLDRRPVDIVVGTLSSFEERKMRKTLESIIAREGNIVYEK